MKQRSRWFLGLAWICMVAGAGPVGAQVCGNRVVEAPEECDDGGFCIGSTNAGTACRADADCPGGQCRAFGGDGCAANCTTERDVRFNLVPGVAQGFSLAPGTSGVVAHAFATLPIPLNGWLVLTLGKERNGEVPVVVKENAIQFPAVEVLSLACGCVRGAAFKTCGGTYFEPDGTLSPDCTDDPSVCNGRKPCAYLHGPGNTLSGVIGCNGLPEANFDYVVDAGGITGTPGDPAITFGAAGGPGTAKLLATIGLDVVLNRCSGSGPAYGPDGQFCTGDDQPDARLAATNPAVTGAASALVTNLADGGEVGPVSVSGAPFSCAKLAAGNPGGTKIVSAFGIPNVPTIGPVVATIELVAQENDTTPRTCAGDCGGDGEVTVDEIVRMVNIALGSAAVSQCLAGDVDGNGDITIDEIIAAVNRALGDC